MSERNVWPVLALGAGAATGIALYLGRKDNAAKGAEMANKSGLRWPIPWALLQGIGDSLLAYRKSTGTPHKGVDLYAEADTRVEAAYPGRVLRVEGTAASAPADPTRKRTPRERAGLFVDVRGRDGRIYRYLHLGRADVEPGQRVDYGTPIGTVAATGTSGVQKARPHLHFEIRESDWDRSKRPADYGPAIDPLTVLPLRLKPRRA